MRLPRRSSRAPTKHGRDLDLRLLARDLLLAATLAASHQVRRLENCLAIDMMVAVRIMHLTYLGRTQPNRPCTIYFEDHQWKALSCFFTKKRVPQKTVPTIREVVGWIAKLDGYLGRNSDRAPERKCSGKAFSAP